MKPWTKKKVVFLCTGNSARSQMAEGLARHLGKDIVEVQSAGLEPKGMHVLAIKVMDEIGIDVRNQQSKSIDPAILSQADWIITVCGHAENRCPATPPHIRREHWPLEDPAQVPGDEQERLHIFRKTRDALRNHIVRFLQVIQPKF